MLPFVHALEHSLDAIPRHQETAEHIHSKDDALTAALPENVGHPFWCVYCQPTLLYTAAPETTLMVRASDARPLLLALGEIQQTTGSQALIRGPPSLPEAAL